MAEIFKNFASTALASDLAFDGGALDLVAPDAFPDLNNVGDYCHLTLVGPNAAEIEIVCMERISFKQVDLTRGMQGTDARDWPAGTKVEMRLTAETLAKHEASADAATEEFVKHCGTAFVHVAFKDRVMRFTTMDGSYHDIKLP
jgi:hypothetical protein